MKESDNKNPKVSIITICLNSGRYLEGAIMSVLGQTYPNIEYIIIDGGSTDGSMEIFNKYRDRIDKFVIEKDNGIFNAMNKGIRLANGEIIYFLNADDKLHNNKVIEKAAAVFESHKEIDFIYGNIAVCDPDKNTFYIEKYPARVSRGLFIRKTIGHPATFFRSSCFKKSGYFDEKYRIASDYEWYLRAFYITKLKALHVEELISLFRIGGTSTSRANRKVYFLERRAIQKKYFNFFESLCADFLYVLRKILLKDRYA